MASTLLLVQLAESIFLGPVGVGLAVGAILAKKGFLLGAAIANRRSRGHRRYKGTGGGIGEGVGFVKRV